MANTTSNNTNKEQADKNNEVKPESVEDYQKRMQSFQQARHDRLKEQNKK